MLKRVAPSVSPTSELAAFVAAKVGSGRYGSASEVVRMGLRLLEERDQLPRNHQVKGETKVGESAR